MKAFAVWLLGVVLVPVVALAQAPAADVNTITGVQVNGGTVTITGTKKPNFTTFTMTDPPRLVIDISEAVFSGVPEESQVGNGTVTGIRTASYGSDASAIARVLIGYEREVETDIQANGNQLIVRVAGGGGQAVAQAQPEAAQPEATQPGAAAQPTAQPTTDGTAAQAAAAAEAERQAQEKAAAEAAAAARAEREAQEKAAAEASARAKQDADAEARRQEEARAATQRQDEAARAAAAQAAADEKKRQEEEARAAAQRAEEERRASAQASAQSSADEKKRQQEEARAAAKAAADEKRADAEAAAEERRAAAQAAADEKRAAAEEAAEARRQRQEEARAARETRVAKAEPPPRREVSGGSDASAEVSSRRKTMTLIGFQQQAGASRVFIRTNEPARYTVSEEGRSVVVELENTRIDLSNNTRPLDTSFFNSPVTRVDADSSGRAVRVTIQLRGQAPYQARQEGNLISLDFQRTGR